MIHRPGKLGLGTAVVEAIHYAAQHDYELLVTMDADFSHSPAAIPELIHCVEGMGRGPSTWPSAPDMLAAAASTAGPGGGAG